MKKFLILYCMPVAGLGEWMKVDEATRKEAESKMKAEWDAWTASHTESIIETAGAGKNVRVTKAGVSEVANDIMMYSLVQGDSAESVSAMFKDHPHFGIPEAWIEIMPANVLPGMQK